METTIMPDLIGKIIGLFTANLSSDLYEIAATNSNVPVLHIGLDGVWLPDTTMKQLKNQGKLQEALGEATAAFIKMHESNGTYPSYIPIHRDEPPLFMAFYGSISSLNFLVRHPTYINSPAVQEYVRTLIISVLQKSELEKMVNSSTSDNALTVAPATSSMVNAEKLYLKIRTILTGEEVSDNPDNAEVEALVRSISKSDEFDTTVITVDELPQVMKKIFYFLATQQTDTQNDTFLRTVMRLIHSFANLYLTERYQISKYKQMMFIAPPGKPRSTSVTMLLLSKKD